MEIPHVLKPSLSSQNKRYEKTDGSRYRGYVSADTLWQAHRKLFYVKTF